MNNNKSKEKLILFNLKTFQRLQVIPFENERQDVANFFKENMLNIFSNLEWIKDEYTFKKRDSRDNGFRVDAIGFWEKNKKSKKIIVLFEYKKQATKGLIEQSKSYINLLAKKSWESEKDKDSLIRLINDNLKRKKGFEHLYKENISWEESKIICVAPDFTPHQIESIEYGEEREKIILIKIVKYVGEILSMEVVGGKLPEWLTIASSKVIEKKAKKSKEEIKETKGNENEVVKSASSINDIINGDENRPSREVKDFLQKIKKLISFLKKSDVAIRIRDHNYRFVVDYYPKKSPKKILFSVEVWKNLIHFEFKNFQPELLNKHNINSKHTIKTDNDFQKLKNFFQEYCETNQKN